RDTRGQAAPTPERIPGRTPDTADTGPGPLPRMRNHGSTGLHANRTRTLWRSTERRVQARDAHDPIAAAPATRQSAGPVGLEAERCLRGPPVPSGTKERCRTGLREAAR